MNVGAKRNEAMLGFYLVFTWLLLGFYLAVTWPSFGLAKVLPMPFVFAWLHTFCSIDQKKICPLRALPNLCLLSR